MSFESLQKMNIREAAPLSDGEDAVRGTGYESVAVAQVEPSDLEMARAGRRFYVGWTTAAAGGPTGRAPQTAIGTTTTATWMLWNGDTASTYFLEGVSLMLLSGTAAAGGTLVYGITSAPIVAPTAATGYLTKNSNAASTRVSKAVFADNQTLGATYNPSFSTPLVQAGGGVMTAAATIGQSILFSEGRGRIGIPPGYAIFFNYISGAGTTPLYLCCPSWVELPTVNA